MVRQIEREFGAEVRGEGEDIQKAMVWGNALTGVEGEGNTTKRKCKPTE